MNGKDVGNDVGSDGGKGGGGGNGDNLNTIFETGDDVCESKIPKKKKLKSHMVRRKKE